MHSTLKRANGKLPTTYSKHAIEKGLSNAKELTELVTKANTEAFNVINKRVTESLDEVRDFAKKRVVAR